MKLYIEAIGEPGTGKTTAMILIEKTLRSRFNIVGKVEQHESGPIDKTTFELILRDDQ